MRVADIQLVFNTEKLIELLNYRGYTIASGYYDSVEKHDKYINDYLNKQNGKKDLTTILGAFVTF